LKLFRTQSVVERDRRSVLISKLASAKLHNSTPLLFTITENESTGAARELACEVIM